METYINPAKAEWPRLMTRCTAADSDITASVRSILDDVRKGGDDALRSLTERFDGYCPDRLEVSAEAIAEACSRVSPEVRKAIDVAASNIERFHRAQLRVDPVIVETMPGVRCEQRVLPIRRVGLYIPGGRAPLFSTVLMLAIPARIAGCESVVMTTPARRDGTISPEILYAASVAGVDAVYAVGGAQAIAAMAYGTASIPKVDKIFGPGNRYVTRAKQIVAAECVAIDMPAGPSEVLVMADDSADPTFVAADLLSQAEHGPDSQGIALCLSAEQAEAIVAAVDTLSKRLTRREILDKSLDNCRVIVLGSLDEMIEFANSYAAEHLIISTRRPEEVADRITAAGSIFLGAYSPESAGDYASGTNHTLPTGGWAMAMNGINTDSYLRRITLQSISAEGLRTLAPVITTMATAEGLDGHALAVELRIADK